MSTIETDVRAAAARLHESIIAARAAGYSVAWPSRAEDLPAIAISATGKAAETWPVALLDDGPAEQQPIAGADPQPTVKAKRAKPA